MILIIDNYDSFTYNLVQYIGELGYSSEIYRNDKISIDEIAEKKPDRIIISPGPCTPKEAGISVDVIRKLGKTFPILGVCLGHQSIGEAYGGTVGRAPVLMHGKTSMIEHYNHLLFKGVSNPFEATRYHSLIIFEDSIPDCLEITARSNDDKLIMGVKHVEYPVWGVQFHPESILTAAGKTILNNFLQS
ncbi:MAG: aminodeoxychorismate/anthranilate synthase component II [Candidatus Auribacter fodinae]|jgi:anthranilate synthase/aminodeoxychorismate synthase-like glutamine amidotransferase|uniref:Aminodeoxychorismate/anthranilate synthase component II n=1 Tax=Candidatus Auribacter fodinae TaxID=2093366 RepID=A0A3A4RFH6_9BACT|nr:MAG: aminodeoxychorismate/anthranilate synthase component II [Candidatus Auribacter fodinae]